MSGKDVTEVVGAGDAGIARAARILESGGLVAVPTETVYGLAARADSPAAVERIYAAKGRPDFNPLIVHVQDAAQAAQFAVICDQARRLMAQYWPGPLTLVLPRRPDARLAEAVTAGLATVALRAPAHPVMQALLGAVDFPLAAPSANLSGFISPTCPDHVLASLGGRIDLVLDGGPCAAGVESTIVAVRGDGRGDGTLAVLRPGPIAIPIAIAGEGGADGGSSAIEAPGQLASHYAPGKPVRLNATEAAPDEFLIGFGAVAGDCTLSASGDVTEAAARLYACLHQAARAAHPRIAVARVPMDGVGRAINDRLSRAATPPDQS
ncbi:MAG: L-threonylcarbamoyladenylate synthase [Erythrobacter sp.]